MTTTQKSFQFSPLLPPLSTNLHDDTDNPIQNFTATGRPFNPAKSIKRGLASLTSADCTGADGADHLPRRYHDDSLISIPVLLPTVPETLLSPISPFSLTSPVSPKWPTSTNSSTACNSGDVLDTTKLPKDYANRLKVWLRRSSDSTSQASSNTSSLSRSKKRKGDNFTMKFVTRDEYLRHYAKDEQGRYVGKEEPAVDCILRCEEDQIKWRSCGPREWKNEIF